MGAVQVAARQLSADPFLEVQFFFLPLKGNDPKQGPRPKGFNVLGGLKGESLLLNDKNKKTQRFDVFYYSIFTFFQIDVYSWDVTSFNASYLHEEWIPTLRFFFGGILQG